MKTAIRMKHPLRSTGTHQTARLLRAIAPGHFRLDERSMQDLITAAHSYARMLTYVDPGGQADGDWTAFWEVENLTYMAVLAAIDTEQLRKGYEDIDLAFGQALIEQEGKPKKGKKNASKDPVSPDFFRQLLCYLRDMAAALEKHYATLRSEIPLKDLLLQLIRRDNHATYEPDDVESTLQQLVAYHKAADDNLDPETYKVFFQPDSRWGIRNRDEYDCILPDELYDREKVRGLFVQLFNVFLTLKARAQQMFDAEVVLLELPEETLERRLEPHIALFITFLQLFRHAQEGMNDIPRRHLDFYYHSVLCLERRPADPDHAYLIFTLAKEFNEELVEKGTLLLAGKDKNGRPIQFETLERWKVTKASVEEIRNTCIAPEFINASTISEKGVPPEKSFRAFGDDGTAPEGELGFAIASPQLFLQEGKREVEVTLNLQGPIEEANVSLQEATVEYSIGDSYHEVGKSDFVLKQLVSPFLPLQTIEPARRLVNDLMSDLVENFTSTNLSPSVLEIYNRYGHAAGTTPSSSANLKSFLQQNIYYPALSGIVIIKKSIAEKKTQLGDTVQVDADLAELYFFRAYYLWSLGSVFAPAYDGTEADTQVPDLINNNLPEDGKDFKMYGLKSLYDGVVEDLFKALQYLTGEDSVNLNDLKNGGAAPDSKTGINVYTTCAFLSRVYLQMNELEKCVLACDVVINSKHYQIGFSTEEDRGEKAKNLLNEIFDKVAESKEVIWAMDASASKSIDTTKGQLNNLFSYLGVRDVFASSSNTVFAESKLLNEVNKQNLRYDERDMPEDSDDAEALSDEGAKTSKKSGKKAPAAKEAAPPRSGLTESPYDYRDLHWFEHLTGQTEPYFSDKYFRGGQKLVPMIRFAEVVLNKAWCLLDHSSTNDSKNNAARLLLNELRERSGSLPFEKAESDFPAHVVNEIQDFHIEEERARELAFEGDRRDFVRVAKSGFKNRFYVAPQTGPEVTQIPNSVDTSFYLIPNQGTKLLSDGALPTQTQDWNSSWLHFADALPLMTEIDRKTIKDSEQSSKLFLSLTLKEDAPAFVPHNGLAQAGITPHPVLRVSFGGESDATDFYNFLKKQNLTQATIKVTVTGIQKNIVLQNDFGVFDGTQRFYPFGPVPENSARFFLGCQEAFTKKLDSVDVTFDWVEEEDVTNGKKGYEDTYANYQELATDFGVPPSIVGTGAKQKSNEGLAADIESTPSIILPIKLPFPQPRVTIDLLKEAEFSTPLLLRGNLFNPPLRFEGSTQNLSSSKSRMVRLFDKLTVAGFDRIISSEQVSKYSATQKRGFLRFKLEGDFGHKAFGFLMTKAAAQDNKGATLPHEPYTPATNSVSLNYTSEQTMEDKPNTDQFFHLLPFGGMRQSKFGTGQTSLVYGYPGPVPEPPTGGFFPANLFLGVKSLVPGDNLSLLFQIAEGSEREPDSRPPKVDWMYLKKGNDWAEIPAQKILRDTTRGLTRSGIIQFATPNDPGKEISSAGNTMLNPALLWLRASVVEVDEQIAPEKVAAFPDLLDIRAQVIEAQFLPAEGNDLERLDSPLPAQSVSGLAESSSAIKKAEQPYATFGGRKPEVEGSSEYHRRVSERLRHKDRAITAWDYERLLLEQYPLAAIAKCIPHTRYESTEGFAGVTELAPGFVTIAVVPDLVRRPNMVRTEPRFSRGDLEEMRDFLVPKANAFVQTVENKHTDKRTDYLQVVNPQYEPVSVALRVWLVRGADQNLAKYELDQALRHFFSPWLKDPERLPQFGRVVRRSHLIQMIEQLDYIDAIEEMAVFHPIDREILSGKPINTTKDEHGKPVWGTWETTWDPLMVQGTLLIPGTARSILTTGEHSIEISDGVGGQGGPAPRAALAPPEMPAESQPSRFEPQPSSLSQQPATSNRKPTAKRK